MHEVQHHEHDLRELHKQEKHSEFEMGAGQLQEKELSILTQHYPWIADLVDQIKYFALKPVRNDELLEYLGNFESQVSVAVPRLLKVPKRAQKFSNVLFWFLLKLKLSFSVDFLQDDFVATAIVALTSHYFDIYIYSDRVRTSEPKEIANDVNIFLSTLFNGKVGVYLDAILTSKLVDGPFDKDSICFLVLKQIVINWKRYKGDNSETFMKYLAVCKVLYGELEHKPLIKWVSSQIGDVPPGFEKFLFTKLKIPIEAGAKLEDEDDYIIHLIKKFKLRNALDIVRDNLKFQALEIEDDEDDETVEMELEELPPDVDEPEEHPEQMQIDEEVNESPTSQEEVTSKEDDSPTSKEEQENSQDYESPEVGIEEIPSDILGNDASTITEGEEDKASDASVSYKVEEPPSSCSQSEADDDEDVEEQQEPMEIEQEQLSSKEKEEPDHELRRDVPEKVLSENDATDKVEVESLSFEKESDDEKGEENDGFRREQLSSDEEQHYDNEAGLEVQNELPGSNVTEKDKTEVEPDTFPKAFDQKFVESKGPQLSSDDEFEESTSQKVENENPILPEEPEIIDVEESVQTETEEEQSNCDSFEEDQKSVEMKSTEVSSTEDDELDQIASQQKVANENSSLPEEPESIEVENSIELEQERSDSDSDEDEKVLNVQSDGVQADSTSEMIGDVSASSSSETESESDDSDDESNSNFRNISSLSKSSSDEGEENANHIGNDRVTYISTTIEVVKAPAEEDLNLGMPVSNEVEIEQNKDHGNDILTPDSAQVLSQSLTINGGRIQEPDDDEPDLQSQIEEAFGGASDPDAVENDQVVDGEVTYSSLEPGTFSQSLNLEHGFMETDDLSDVEKPVPKVVSENVDVETESSSGDIFTDVSDPSSDDDETPQVVGVVNNTQPQVVAVVNNTPSPIQQPRITLQRSVTPSPIQQPRITLQRSVGRHVDLLGLETMPGASTQQSYRMPGITPQPARMPRTPPQLPPMPRLHTRPPTPSQPPPKRQRMSMEIQRGRAQFMPGFVQRPPLSLSVGGETLVYAGLSGNPPRALYCKPDASASVSVPIVIPQTPAEDDDDIQIVDELPVVQGRFGI